MRMLKRILVAAILTIPPAAAAQPVVIGLIKVAEVQRLRQQSVWRVVLVDVRSREEYLARHITGAVSIPLDTIEARAQELPRQGLVVLY
jgi:3-mercaptopyruvate sulfurtransferase SseA